MVGTHSVSLLSDPDNLHHTKGVEVEEVAFIFPENQSVRPVAAVVEIVNTELDVVFDGGDAMPRSRHAERHGDN